MKPAGGSSKGLKQEWVYAEEEDIICPVVLNEDGTINVRSLLELSGRVALEKACGALSARSRKRR